MLRRPPRSTLFPYPPLFRSSRLIAGADLTSQAARFVFESPQGEFARVAAIEQVFVHECFQAAAPFALGHMCELVNKKFAVPPAVCPDDDAVANRHPTRRVGYDLSAAGGVGEFFVVR